MQRLSVASAYTAIISSISAGPIMAPPCALHNERLRGSVPERVSLAPVRRQDPLASYVSRQQAGGFDCLGGGGSLRLRPRLKGRSGPALDVRSGERLRTARMTRLGAKRNAVVVVSRASASRSGAAKADVGCRTLSAVRTFEFASELQAEVNPISTMPRHGEGWTSNSRPLHYVG